MFCDHNMAEPYNQTDNNKDHANKVWALFNGTKLDWFMSCVFFFVTSNVG